MSLDTPTAVIAPTRESFLDWCQREEISPNSKGVIWVRGPRDLRGRSKVRVVVANEYVVVGPELKRDIELMRAQGYIVEPVPVRV